MQARPPGASSRSQAAKKTGNCFSPIASIISIDASFEYEPWCTR